MLLNDVLVYRPPSCTAFLQERACLSAGPGVRCLWSRSRCVPWGSAHNDDGVAPATFCPPKTRKSPCHGRD